VVGGGFTSTRPQGVTPPLRLAIVYESHRAGDASWLVSAHHLGTPPNTLELTAIAYCRKGGGKLTEVAAPVTIGSTARSEARSVATCPGKSHAVSGGFQIPAFSGGIFVYPTANALADKRSWGVTGVRSGADGPAGQAVTAFAYCAKGKKGTPTRSASTTATSAPVDVVPSVTTPSCKKPRKPLGGGFLAPYADSGGSRETIFVTESQRLGRTWKATGFVLGSSGLALNLTALGYCS
jgi:hypothetical protein